MAAKTKLLEAKETFNTKPLKGNILELRKETGLNQKDFWGQFGVTQSGGSRYESGRTIPKPVNGMIRKAYPKFK